MKEAIKIPEGVKELKISQESGRVVIEFVPKFKEGDFVYEDRRIMIIHKYPHFHKALVYPPHDTKVLYNSKYGLPFSSPSFRFATEEEKKLLLDALEKDGAKWNAEKLCVEDIPEEPKEGDLCIFWDDRSPECASISYYKEKMRNHRDITGLDWDCAIKWDGTREQYEKFLRGEIKI